MKVVFMVNAKQNHSREFSSRKVLEIKFCAPVFEIMCPEPSRKQNNLPHTIKIMVSYIRRSSYCFYIAVNRICVAISRVDGVLQPWSAIHLGVGNSKQKPAYLDLPVPVM